MAADLRVALACAVVACAAAGCQTERTDFARGGVVQASAPESAAPVKVAVGPVPGSPEPPFPPNPYRIDPIAIAEGQKLFMRFNCAGCHGDHGGGGMGPSLRDEDWIYGNADAQIAASIAEGRAHGMPAWGTKIPTEQILKLQAYIASMRTPREPQPPE